jgi:hypothetical protein
MFDVRTGGFRATPGTNGRGNGRLLQKGWDSGTVGRRCESIKIKPRRQLGECLQHNSTECQQSRLTHGAAEAARSAPVLLSCAGLRR